MNMQFTCPGCGSHYFIRTVSQELEYLNSELMLTPEGLQTAETKPWNAGEQKLRGIRCAECGRSWASLEVMQQAGTILPHPMNGKRIVPCTVYGEDGTALPVNLLISEEHELTAADMKRVCTQALGAGRRGLVICPEMARQTGALDIAL